MAYAERRESSKGARYRGFYKDADGRYKSAGTYGTERRALERPGARRQGGLHRAGRSRFRAAQATLGSARGTPRDSGTWPGTAPSSGAPSPGTRREGTTAHA
jgi:hypothetical protein